MSLLPSSATFEERVQDCFLAYRGFGVMLSALDVELLERWALLQVPFEVVARGIRKAAEGALWDARPGETLRSLRACKRQVEAEIKKHLGATVGKEGELAAVDVPTHLRRHKKLTAVLKKLSREKPQVASGIARLLAGPLAEPPADLERSSRQEELVYLGLLRALPFAERLVLLREAAALAQNGASLSARAKVLSRRFHRAAVVRRRLSLPPFW
ncbi:MAG: hypothetical protein ACOZIN_14980 [Myxococcota bacterium]